MHIQLCLALSQDAHSVPVARGILKCALDAVSVRRDLVGDLELALTEACTNVLDHSPGSGDFEVVAGIDRHCCVVEVVDKGTGFAAGKASLPSPSAEAGRGLLIMQEVTDRVSVDNVADRGTVVRFEKRLVLEGAGDR
jgi:serine/threonine-protein kinase RsbW